MRVVDKFHSGYVHKRRIRVLCAWLALFFPQNACVLDVGCGDGLIAKLIMERRPDVKIQGIDVLVRPQTHIPVMKFDGEKIPCTDASFDAVMFVDVLHHTDDPMILLHEARRVARRAVVMKDHTRDGLLAGVTLRFMDCVGNARHGVALPYNYWPLAKWHAGFEALGMSIEFWERRLRLYPVPFNILFERSLHFVAKIGVSASHAP